MVHIQNLEVKGFKSFNKKQEIELNNGLETFIGANGSGKTNIKDSISFVLGKLSSKDMRVKDFSKLIFHGGKGVNPAKKASVKLVLNNSDKQLPDDSQKVIIERSVGKDGRSTYRINGNRTTRKRVLNLLSYAKIEPGGYNIINQGQVARFVKLSSEERKDIIKDISGIGKYEKKKEKALDELEEVERKEDKAEVLLNEKEERLDELREEKEKAEELVSLKKEFKKKKGALVNKKIDRESNKKEKIIEEIERKGRKVKSLKKDKKKTKEKIKAIERELEEIKSKKKGVETEGKKLNRKIQKIREKERGIAGSKNSKEEEVEKLEKRLEKDEEYIERLKEDIEDKKEKKEELKERLEDRKSEIEEEGAEIKEKTEEIEEKIEEINDELFQLEVKKEKAKRRKEVEKRVKEAKKELKIKKEELEEVKGRIKELDSELKSLKKEREEKQEKLEEKKENLRELERKKRLATNFKKKGIRKIKELKKKGGIKGVRGTVSELGEVKDKYSLALKVAASGRLNNIVVEDEDVASRCIEALKRNKAGIATFLPTNKISGRMNAPRGLKKKEGAIDFAINLLEFDERYKNIFSYVLSSTLVVKDLEAAKRIGIGKVRMVTLEGDLVSKGGSMTGGSRKKDHALGFKAKGLRKDIEETKTSISILKEDMNHLKDKIDIKEDSIISKREKKARLESKIENLEEKVDVDLEEGPSLKEIKRKRGKLKERREKKKEKLKELEVSSYEKRREKLNKIELELEETNTAIKMKEDELENSKERLKSSKEEFKELKDEIKELGEKLREKEKKIGELQSKKEEVTSKLDKINKELENVKGNLEKKKEENKRLEKKIETLKESKNRNLIKKKEIETKLKNLKEQAEKLEEVNINKELKELEKEVEKLEKSLDDFGKVNMKAIDQFEKIKEEFKELKDKFENIREEKEEVLGLIDKIESRKNQEFLETFESINNNFSRVFQKLTGDGEGRLTLENEKEPLEGGVEMQVKSSKRKKLSSLRSLSGGEKALTTLAFIFAIQEHEPAPFYILDEIDAALDKENSKRLASLLEEYTKDSQFVLITHNNTIIKKADDLFGVAMNERGGSRVYSINLEE